MARHPLKLSARKLSTLRALFKGISSIKIVYLFGSMARRDNGPMSDFDFAVYLDSKKSSQFFDVLLTLMAKIPLLLGTDKVDVVIINAIDNLILKHNIIMEGEVLYEVPGYRINAELAILGEYRDFRILERQYYPE